MLPVHLLLSCTIDYFGLLRLICIGLLLTPCFASAELTEEEKQRFEEFVQITEEEVEKTVQGQLEAFQAKDAERAYSYLTPKARARAGSPQKFMQMIQKKYPALYNPVSFELRGLEPRRGILQKTVNVVGPDFLDYRAFFKLQPQPDGKWSVVGASVVRVQVEEEGFLAKHDPTRKERKTFR